MCFGSLVAVAAFAAIQPASDALSEEFTVPGREGFEANREIASVYGNGGDAATVLRASWTTVAA